MHEPGIKNLIFDLGGVILDLSVDHTLQAFASLSGLKKEQVREIFAQSPGFEQYEKGLLTDAEFRNAVRDAYGITPTDQEIDTAWNAMLRGIPMVKLNLLTHLKQKYNVLLLSNTNDIHLSYINDHMMPGIEGAGLLEDYFHRAYYSHRMKMRKPDAEIFERVLDENGFKAEETLFLDDNALNIEGARGLNIRTVLVTTPGVVLEYFHE